MIPNKIARGDIIQAAKYIDQNGVPDARRSRRYDVVINGKKYPPKYIISISWLSVKGKEYSPNNFNAIAAKDFLKRLGFEIHDRINVKITEMDEYYATEGNKKYRTHLSYDRDRSIVRETKRSRLQQAGTLSCDVCGFDFSKTYGKRGDGFIEAHHNTPLSEIRAEHSVTAQDFSLVCSNCHRMLHAKGKLITVKELKAIHQRQQQRNNEQ